MPGYRDFDLDTPLNYRSPFRAAPPFQAPPSFQAANVPVQAPITASVPIREVGGRITPAPDASGLYAIYGRRNPYEAATRQPGGMGINFAAPIAAYLSGRFERQRNIDIKEFEARKKEYDRIQGKREDIEFNARMTERALAAGQEAYFGTLSSGGDYDAASKSGTDAVNAYATDNGVMMPPIKNVHFWKGGDASLASSKEGGGTITLVKKGDVYAWNDNGKMRPVPKDAMGFTDMARMARADRPAGGDPRGMLTYYDSEGRLVAKTKNEGEAIKAGAVFVGQTEKYIDETTGEMAWRVVPVGISDAVLRKYGMTPAPKAGSLEVTQRGGLPIPPVKAKEAERIWGGTTPEPVGILPGSRQQPPTTPAVQLSTSPQPGPVADPKRAEAIRILEGQKAKLTEANIAYVMGQLK